MNCGAHNLYIKLKIVNDICHCHVALFHVTSLCSLFLPLSPSSPAVMFGGKVIRNDSIAILRERRKHENIESKHSSTSSLCHCLYLIPMPLPLPHSHATASTSSLCHYLYLIPMLLPLPHSHAATSTSFPCYCLYLIPMPLPLPHLKIAFPSHSQATHLTLSLISSFCLPIFNVVCI